ncbi:hypothetical protein LTR84_012406 [Exophiala bonariae]|uniref:Azaphilone pigments biosynthesis cluster protein L N-terminal domain-containing protein n=1 Tax=Exophiala bonariae TaxID=1690606 RepID=A0AAV9MRU7_9EURO|nr:hypothetical protein LTR84_012406 [Exophiala bonariae]
MGGDIDSFRRYSAGYKLTITIALTNVTLHKSTVTRENLENYKNLIGAATEDLQAHLETINKKLEMPLQRTETDSSSDSLEAD